MKYTNGLMKGSMLMLMGSLMIAACNKPERPEFGNYPVDSNPPGGPLKFYAAYDGSNVDSIRANFGTDNNATIVDGGVSGSALQLDGSNKGFVSYPTANDFGKATSFTIAFWINVTLAQKDNSHAVGVLTFASSSNFW